MTGMALPSPNFHATPAGRRLATTYDLACSRPCGSSVESSLEPGALRPEALPLGHRGLPEEFAENSSKESVLGDLTVLNKLNGIFIVLLITVFVLQGTV
ncbi:hypothetical protein AVEN_83943-1 [Araneus ventricosus]|uniref:Uncharacterized protein n=1 Tax=Araneus ventricosus TaxID=182803 RepID=A0A4Y2T2H2_ARAVE|nr:hypothetical protein AVEN_83943-1 [Araneus ventricosus]